MGRGWSRIRLLIVALLVLSACTSTTARQLAALPIAGDGPMTVGDRPDRSAPPSPAPRAAPQPRAPQAAIPYRVTPEWAPTQVNFDWGRRGSVDYIVIHYTAISYARTLRAFSLPSSGVSAHYVVRNDGHVAQVVGESNVAWHAGNAYFNEHSVGIEIEKSNESNPEFTPDEYYAAAALACQIAGRHGIPLDRAHVVGHNEIPWPNNHSDPGPTWNWPFFMWLTSLCAPATSATVHASLVSQSPFPDVTIGASAPVTIVLRNTGATAWRKGTPQEARIGVRGNSKDLAFLARGWPTPDRVAVQVEDIVAPGGTATFTFSVGANDPGTYVLPLRGVVDGGAWMDDIGMYVVLNARPLKNTLE